MATDTNTTQQARPRGVDVSNHDGHVDWAKVKAAGIAFAFIKASQGTGFHDPWFTTNWVGAKAAGILRGGYHYLLGAVDGVKQAEYFLSIHGRHLQQGDLQPVVDIELDDNHGVSGSQMIATATAYCAHIKAVLGKDPIVYTYPDYWHSYLGGTKALSQYPLWFARYGPSPLPLPGGWKQWTFWQDNDHGRVPGVRDGKGDCDTDVFNGSAALLRRFAGYP